MHPIAKKSLSNPFISLVHCRKRNFFYRADIFVKFAHKYSFQSPTKLSHVDINLVFAPAKQICSE